MGVGFSSEMRGKGARSWKIGKEKIPLSRGRGIYAGNGEGNKLKDVVFLPYLSLNFSETPLNEDSLSIKARKKKKELRPFRLIISTAVEGCSYAEGAQGDSDAVSL